MKPSGDYASGIAVPFRGDSDGGVSIDEGDAYIRGLVLQTVAPNESDNPFQDLGDESPIFQNPDSTEWQVRWRRRIRSQMQTLEDENLARLISVEFQMGGEGEYQVVVTYINLESTRRADVTASVISVADGGVAIEAGAG